MMCERITFLTLIAATLLAHGSVPLAVMGLTTAIVVTVMSDAELSPALNPPIGVLVGRFSVNSILTIPVVLASGPKLPVSLPATAAWTMVALPLPLVMASMRSCFSG